MTVHAFVDESERNRTYLLCAAIIDPGNVGWLRKYLKSLRLPGQHELHFKKEAPSRQRALADQIARLPASVFVYSAPTIAGPEQARQRCLARAVADLQELNAHRLVLDTRQSRDVHDKTTIQRLLGHHPSRTGFTYEHVDSASESLLWIADTAAWCYGASGDFRRRIMPIISKVIEA